MSRFDLSEHNHIKLADQDVYLKQNDDGQIVVDNVRSRVNTPAFIFHIDF